jgi:hypothetical protein
MDESAEKAPLTPGEEPAHPAREMSLHLLRMLETRLEAAGIVLQSRASAWCRGCSCTCWPRPPASSPSGVGIVLLAIALPPNLRIPVLSGVVAAFVLGACGVRCRAHRMIAGKDRSVR